METVVFPLAGLRDAAQEEETSEPFLCSSEVAPKVPDMKPIGKMGGWLRKRAGPFVLTERAAKSLSAWGLLICSLLKLAQRTFLGFLFHSGLKARMLNVASWLQAASRQPAFCGRSLHTGPLYVCPRFL